LAVDIDLDLEALQEDLGKWYKNSQKLIGKTITLVLYDLIKKRCPFEKFINLLWENNIESSVGMFFTQ
jgi:hypothetical protein